MTSSGASERPTALGPRPLAEARARVAAAGGPELLDRLDHLEAHLETRLETRNGARPVGAPPPAPDRGATPDFDAVIAGGGLWSMLAPVLAARGLRVAVLDRGRIGLAHREWNASLGELASLVRAGLLTEADLTSLIVARYRAGVCRFHGGAAYPVTGVLDCAVDAGALLSLARRRGELAGVTYLDGHTVVAHASGPRAATLRAQRADGVALELSAKVFVDARGVSSPFASADLVCPTVGGVVTGLSAGSGPTQVDPGIGEILATVDGVEQGRQYVWEAFPGRPSETTVYLFYYARASEPTSLVELYARFFASLPRYKDGAAELVRPTFGLIPGWSRLVPPARSLDARIVLVGDAAARHSPLTYCGFGSMLRSLLPAADAIVAAADTDAPCPDSIVDDGPIHSFTGALAHLMAARVFEGDELNLLLDAAFRTLHEMGQEPYAALLRDEMRPEAFVDFLGRTASRHPAVWGKVLRGMGIGGAGRWGLGVARALMTRPGVSP